MTNNIWAYISILLPLSLPHNQLQLRPMVLYVDVGEIHDSVNRRNWNLVHSAGEGADQIHTSDANNKDQLYRVVMENRRGAEPWVFWNEGAGLTWENWDFSIFHWIGENAAKVIRITVAVTVSLHCSPL